MSIEGRVSESLRRELYASRPLVIQGAHDLDGCWALDRAIAECGEETAVHRVLDEVRALPAQRATVAVAARMAEHLQRYRWPADLVVVPVPSRDPVVDVLARAIAFHLEVPCRPLLKLRGASVDMSDDRRVAARARAVPSHVLLIDGRLDTGGMLRACASTLRDRGAQAVWAMVAVADVRTEAVSEPGAHAAAPTVASGEERGELADVWEEPDGDEACLTEPGPPEVATAPVERSVADEERDEQPIEHPVTDEHAVTSVDVDGTSPRLHLRTPTRRNRRAHKR